MRAVPASEALKPMVVEYMREKVGEYDPGEHYVAFVVVDDAGNMVAGVIVSNYRETDCEISCASDSPAAWRPHVCRAIFSYIFEQLGCVRCTSITTKANKKAKAFLQHFGFQLEGKLRLGYDGKRDALIYGLLKAECPFLGAARGTLNEGASEPDRINRDAAEGRDDRPADAAADAAANGGCSADAGYCAA